MEKVIKIPQEILDKIADLQREFVKVINQIGDIEIGIFNLNKAKVDLMEKYSTMRTAEKDIIENIGTQFGYGKLNLEKGELIVEEKTEKV